MATHKPITILHMSDIQVEGVQEDKMLEMLLYDLNSISSLYGLSPSVVVVSGDLTEQAKVNEFHSVSNFFNKMMSQLRIKKDNLVIVPGNHDISWPSCKDYFKSTSKPKLPYTDKWENYFGFFNNFYGNNAPDGFVFTKSQPWTLFEIKSTKTVFAGLNSTWDESHKKEDHHGKIGSRQLQWFRSQLKKYKERNWLRIAVLHHNPMLSFANDDSYLKDRSDFAKDIIPNVNLVLHGHTHRGEEQKINNVPLLSTGSASASESKIPAGISNQYQIVQIWPNYYKRWARIYSKERENWIGDCSISVNGNTWNERHHNRFLSVGETFPDQIKKYSYYANGYLDAGDATSALAIISKELNKFASFSLKQKFGLYNKSDIQKFDELLKTKNSSQEEWKDLQVARLRLYSQEEELEELNSFYNKVLKQWPKTSRMSRGALHRIGVTKAIQKGYKEAKPSFSLALKISKGNKALILNNKINEHSVITTKLLEATAKFFCCMERPNRDEALECAINSQEKFLTAEYDWKTGQAFPVKSTYQALFTEAAILLYCNINDLKGWTRLIAAHLLISRHIITPKAEGYAELLSMVYTEKYHFAGKKKKAKCLRRQLRSILKAAMYSEKSKRKKFLSKLVEDDSKFRILIPMSEVYNLVPFQDPLLDDWIEFRKFLDDLDNRLCIL